MMGNRELTVLCSSFSRSSFFVLRRWLIVDGRFYSLKYHELRTINQEPKTKNQLTQNLALILEVFPHQHGNQYRQVDLPQDTQAHS